MAVAMVTAAAAVVTEVINIISPTHMNSSSLRMGNPTLEPRHKPLHRVKLIQLLTLMRYMAGTTPMLGCGIRQWRSNSNSKARLQVASLPREAHERFQMIPHGDGDALAADTWIDACLHDRLSRCRCVSLTVAWVTLFVAWIFHVH